MDLKFTYPVVKGCRHEINNENKSRVKRSIFPLMYDVNNILPNATGTIINKMNKTFSIFVPWIPLRHFSDFLRTQCEIDQTEGI